MNESLTFHSKSFFGEAVEATLYLYQEDRIVYETAFEDGRAVLSLPDLVEPGVYDLVAQREGGDSYRINSFMLPLATHLFRHAQLHSDLSLTADNLDSQTIIERRKVDPDFFSYLSELPPDARGVFDSIVESMGHQGLCWGGMVCFYSRQIVVNRGEALIGANLVKWDDTYLNVPETGTYQIGVDTEGITFEPDIPLATITVDADDFVRIDLNLAYHTLIRGEEAYYFLDFEETSEDIDIPLDSKDRISGPLYENTLYGRSSTALPTNRISLSFENTGPVFFTNRLYLYGDTDYFLLFDLNNTLDSLDSNFLGGTLLTALPRYTNSNVTVDWSEGITLVSSGEEGEVVYRESYLYPESPVVFLDGAIPQRTETPLEQYVDDYGLLFDFDSDFTEEVSEGATLNIHYGSAIYPTASNYPSFYPVS